MSAYWFFAFLLIPLIVHLFSFRRTKKVLFPNIQFIKKGLVQTERRTKLKHYLILLTRLFFFAAVLWLILLALLHKEKELHQNPFYYIDNSISLSIEKDGVNGLELAKNYFNTSMSKQKRATVLSNDFLSFSNRPRKKDEIREFLYQMDFTNYARSTTSIFNRVIQSDAATIVWFSDFQNFNKNDAFFIQQDTFRNYQLIINTHENLRNVFIDTLYLTPKDNQIGAFRLTVNLSSNDVVEEENITIKVLRDGKLFSSIVQSVKEKAANFDIRAGYGYEVQISGDDVLFDNYNYFYLPPTRKPNVVLLADEKNPYLSKVFSNDSLFYFYEMNLSNIDFEKLNSADVILLNSLKEIPRGLKNVSQKQQSIIIFPSPDINKDSYNQFLQADIQTLADTVFYEAKINFNHSTFNGVFAKKGDEFTELRAKGIFKLNQPSDEIIGLRNKTTLFSKLNQKSIYLLNTPLDSRYTNLAQNAIFLPLMYRIAMTTIQQDKLYHYFPEQVIEIREYSGELLKIINDEFEYIPESSRDKDKLLVQIPNNIKAGFYQLMQGDTELLRFGVNVPHEESVIVDTTLEYIKETFKKDRHVAINSINIRNQEVKLEENSTLWKYVLVLCFVLLLIETSLHRILK